MKTIEMIMGGCPLCPVVWAGGCQPKETGEDVLRSTNLRTGYSDHPFHCNNMGCEKATEVSDMVEAEEQ